MTDLPTLRDALHDATRQYPRRRRRRTITLAARTGTAALTVCLGLFFVARASSGPATEISATPTPAAASPARGVVAVASPTSSVKSRPLDPRTVKAATIRPGDELVAAWSVPGLGGAVYLFERGGDRCLSVPDQATAAPDTERGVTCASAATVKRDGVSLVLGSSYVAVLPGSERAVTVETPGAPEQTVSSATGGLIAIADLRDRTTVTRYDADGRPRTQRIEARQDQRRDCPDGRLFFIARGDPDPCRTPPVATTSGPDDREGFGSDRSHGRK